MPSKRSGGADAKFRAAVRRASRPASRRPRSGTQVTHHAETAIGGGSNAVAGNVMAHSTSQGRASSTKVSPTGVL